jgi:flavin reductase (DIM6/NTAB) family NADH-FMN oxidoreductase RutF
MGTMADRPIRDALRMIAPGPVTLLSTLWRGQANCMTASWVRCQSLIPTQLSVAVHPDRLTHQFLNASEQVVINIPVYEMISLVHRAGITTGRDGDKFAALELEPADALVVDAPRIAGCPAYIECEVRDRTSAGDHDLFILEAVAVQADDEAFDGFWTISTEAGQLLHHLGADRYAGLTMPYRIIFDDKESDEG